MKKRIYKIALTGIVIILILLLVFYLLLPHIKELAFYQLIDGKDLTIYLLGTLHSTHLKFPWYSLGHIQALIKNLDPDLLLIESRPEELVNGNWGDGPIEMPFAALTAQSLGIEVQGMDWWKKEDLLSDSTEREDRMMQNILAALQGHRIVLILTGWSHVKGFLQRLEKAGYIYIEFPSAEKQKLFDISGTKFVFPPGMSYYIQKRIDIDTVALLSESDSEWISRLESGIKARQKLLKIIEKVGEESP